MKLAVICFTQAGARTACRLMEGLLKEGDLIEGYGKGQGLKPVTTSLGEWTKKQFLEKDGIVFIGAMGIAVRSIAPYLKGKAVDPAVVVLDDEGKFCISVLSGHLGGANELAGRAAAVTGGQAVITTATDVHGKFAADLFAKRMGLAITDLKKVKMVSAAVLREETVGFYSDFPIEGTLPEELCLEAEADTGLFITIKDLPEKGKTDHLLRLIPKIVILGIGCRKGTSVTAIRDGVSRVINKYHLSPLAIAGCASIDLKKEEEGICAFAAETGIPFYTYPAEILAETEGEFTPSPFVKQITGVDNVCERAALCCVKELGGGKLIVKKEVAAGVTVAAAVRDWKVKL
ncbi:cobalt-precorrin 5A hydrolase [Lacrimispora amygdalina]|uniref:cobalt-precorrin 5A hydrolase n=1 Tax=Lacrimispora amygdalina TaxID=253257 RepID=UPI000BE31458|nr:cobalamin biosynthesis protein [Lacrimispora amygdalina]